jgi:hypothetical protein
MASGRSRSAAEQLVSGVAPARPDLVGDGHGSRKPAAIWA